MIFPWTTTDSIVSDFLSSADKLAQLAKNKDSEVDHANERIQHWANVRDFAVTEATKARTFEQKIRNLLA